MVSGLYLFIETVIIRSEKGSGQDRVIIKLLLLFHNRTYKTELNSKTNLKNEYLSMYILYILLLLLVIFFFCNLNFL